MKIEEKETIQVSDATNSYCPYWYIIYILNTNDTDVNLKEDEIKAADVEQSDQNESEDSKLRGT